MQKDFSVTNRLLSSSPYNECSKPHSDISYPSCYPHGWQYLLPTDQGSVSASRSGWQGVVPNATISLPRTTFELQNFRADGPSPYAGTLSAAPGYSLTQHDHTQNPSREPVSHQSGATTPLHHAKDMKEVSAVSPTSPTNDQQRNGKQIPDTRSSSTGKSYSACMHVCDILLL